MKIKLFAMDVDGTMTDGRFTVDANGNETKTFNVKDGMAISLLEKQGIKTAILTNHKSDVVENRAKQLKIDYYYDNCSNKVEVMQSIINQLGISMNEVAYVGDDINDLELLKIVGVSGCPSDAVSDVKQVCNYVCNKAGGFGAVREFAERVIMN